jgi:hypothetical protein
MKNCSTCTFFGELNYFLMQITIQPLEITYNTVPYRFIVKKVFNTSRNEITFHCWAPEDNWQSRELIKTEVLMFEWDAQSAELKPHKEGPVSDTLREAIQAHFLMERA